MKIVKAQARKYKNPIWWENLLDAIPDIRPIFLNQFILDNPTLVSWFKAIPLQCPFNKAWEIRLDDGTRHLIYYVPALCKLNPLYNWIVDVKIEIFEQDKKDVQLQKLAAIPTVVDVPIPPVQSILKH